MQNIFGMGNDRACNVWNNGITYENRNITNGSYPLEGSFHNLFGCERTIQKNDWGARRLIETKLFPSHATNHTVFNKSKLSWPVTPFSLPYCLFRFLTNLKRALFLLSSSPKKNFQPPCLLLFILFYKVLGGTLLSCQQGSPLERWGPGQHDKLESIWLCIGNYHGELEVRGEQLEVLGGSHDSVGSNYAL